jgi:hypothetical protein
MWWKRKAKYEDLRAKLDKEIFKYLERKDFQKGYDDSVYYLIYKKKTNFGFEIFELEYLILTEELKICFGLRFNEIENIYDKIHQIESRENAYSLFIDSVNLLHFNEVNRAKFKFNKTEDIDIGFKNAKFIFENYAEEYFKKYDSISKFSELVNREKYVEDLRGNFQNHGGGSKEDRAASGIIASKILKEKDTEDLKRKYLENITSKDLESIFNSIDKYFEKKI